ncbi:Protein TolR [Candidatus Profftia lariciata]|uniref:colicin uptake protein TolR n=1 Tax=Candidatus Profftia lariciata TaxID=1987921 RepID=UPI001D0138A8|nr:colicin uptake protein TolR [Candidatus Profftia lariciata]UDG81505.1 Protein TolR [Candidatus Profftia lariciata]
MRSIDRRKIQNEINIVPLLDILLVLILIFIATTPIITQNIKVNLPDSKNTTKLWNNLNPTVIVEVYEKKKYTIIIEQNRIAHIPEDRVIQIIQSYLKVHPKTVFLIGGDKQVSYDNIIKAINILHLAGVISVGLMTHPV